MKKIGGVFAFKVKDGPNGQEATWVVDVKNGSGSVHNDTGEEGQLLADQFRVFCYHVRPWKPVTTRYHVINHLQVEM